MLLAAVIGFTFLAYANSFRAPLILDNDEIVLKDARVHAATPVQLHRILTQQYWETANTGLVAGAAISALLIGFAARTYGRNGDWLDQQRFWLSAAAAAPGSYKTNMAAAANTFMATQEDMVRSIHYADRALAIIDGLPDSQNSARAYYDAGIFYRNVGDGLASRLATTDGAGKAPAGGGALSWYRKSLNAFLRSERIELAWDERYRAENAQRSKPGLTSLPSKLYLDLGRAYMRLSDLPRALAAFERGRTLESAPDLLQELGSACRAAGDPRQAAMALVEALAMDPTGRSWLRRWWNCMGRSIPRVVRSPVRAASPPSTRIARWCTATSAGRRATRSATTPARPAIRSRFHPEGCGTGSRLRARAPELALAWPTP